MGVSQRIFLGVLIAIDIAGHAYLFAPAVYRLVLVIVYRNVVVHRVEAVDDGENVTVGIVRGRRALDDQYREGMRHRDGDRLDGGVLDNEGDLLASPGGPKIAGGAHRVEDGRADETREHEADEYDEWPFERAGGHLVPERHRLIVRRRYHAGVNGHAD